LEKAFIISEKEKQLKNQIYNIYSELKNGTSSDRQKDIEKLADKVFRWCLEYSFAKDDDKYNTVKMANNMGWEVFDFVVNGLFDKKGKANETLNIPEGEDGFFRYLKGSLNTGRISAINDMLKNEKGFESKKWKKRKLKEYEEYLGILEQNMGRAPSVEEKIQHLCIKFGITEKQVHKDLELIERQTLSLEEGDSEFTVLDSGKTKHFDGRPASDDPEDDFLADMNTALIRDNVEKFLGGRQDRTKEVFKELFTLACIKKVKNYKELIPVLSDRIVKGHKKDGETLTQAKIYLYHHPGIKPESAEARASNMWGEMRTWLKSSHNE
jgi:hypothetical protein